MKDAIQYRVRLRRTGIFFPGAARQRGGKPVQNGTVTQTANCRSVTRNDETPFSGRASEDEPEYNKMEFRLRCNNLRRREVGGNLG